MEDDFRYFLSLKLVKELLGVSIHEIVKILYHRNEFRVFFHVDLFELIRKGFNEKERAFRLFSEVQNGMNQDPHDD